MTQEELLPLLAAASLIGLVIFVLRIVGDEADVYAGLEEAPVERAFGLSDDTRPEDLAARILNVPVHDAGSASRASDLATGKSVENSGRSS